MAKKADEKIIKKIFSRGVDEVIVRGHLEEDLRKGTDLRIKLGADPTAPDLHLGHAVILRKLREFQELGHVIVFIIGDYTALVGDPTDRSKTRPQLDAKAIARNAKTYFEQVGKILDLKKTEIHYNSEWFKKMTVADMIALASKFSAQRILERDDFSKRIKEGVEVAVHEELYPIMQAHDSVVINASVEIGGTDQKFNVLAGRELQKKMGLFPQDVITCPLLVGTDGTHKMSKSLGNYIGITDAPADMFGKVMSIPDKVIIHYFELATDLPREEIDLISKSLKAGANPRDIKARLAGEIVALYHGAKAAKAAGAAFDRVFSKKETPEDVPEAVVSKPRINILDLLIETKLVASKGEARRVVEQGGVKVDNEVLKDINTMVEPAKGGSLVQKGKHIFLRVRRK